MPVILAILGAVSTAVFFYWRAKNARDAAGDLLDAANDVRLAARRFGFKRRLNVHPVDSVDDARLAASGIVMAIASLDHAITQAELDTATIQCQSKFSITKTEAEEIVAFGRWLAEQCGNGGEAVRRLSKRVLALAGQEALPDLLEMAQAVAMADNKELDEFDEDALATIRRIFGQR